MSLEINKRELLRYLLSHPSASYGALCDRLNLSKRSIRLLIESLLYSYNHILSLKEVEGIVKDILELIAQSLEEGNRIEVRGFGSFSLHHRQPRVGRNPKTGDSVKLDAKSVPHFKAGKELKDRVNVFA